MADNIPFSPDLTKIIATDEILGVQYQIVKLAYGALDSALVVSTATPLPTQAPSTGTANNGSVTVTNVATVVRALNSTRIGLTLQNLGAVDVFWGHDNTVTTSTGLKIPAGGSAEIDSRYNGAIYAIVSAGSADVRFWEVG